MQQATGSRQQAAGSRQQAAGSRQELYNVQANSSSERRKLASFMREASLRTGGPGLGFPYRRCREAGMPGPREQLYPRPAKGQAERKTDGRCRCLRQDITDSRLKKHPLSSFLLLAARQTKATHHLPTTNLPQSLQKQFFYGVLLGV